MILKAKKILKDNNLSETHQPYLDLLKTLNKNIGYVGTFTQFLIEDKTNLDELKSLYRDILDVKDVLPKLDKNVIDFKSFKDLRNSIDELKLNREVRRFFNELPSKQKEFLYDDRKGEFKTYQQLYELSNERITSPRGINTYYLNCEKLLQTVIKETTETQRLKFLRGVSAYRYNSDFIKRLMGLKNLPSVDKVIETVKRTPNTIITHIDEENGIIIVRLLNFEACNALASSTNWCISYDKKQFRNYIRKGKQFMIFNLYAKDERYSMIGFTTNLLNKVTDIFDKYNHESSSYIADTELRHIFLYRQWRYTLVSNIKKGYFSKNLNTLDDNSSFLKRIFNRFIDWY